MTKSGSISRRRYPSLTPSDRFASSFSDVEVFGTVLEIGPASSAEGLDEAWNQLHTKWCGKTKTFVSTIPEVARYRYFYEQIGLNPDRSPPSTQNLIQRFLLGATVRPLPPLPYVVNLINIVAVETLIPLGAFDCSRLIGQVEVDFADDDECLVPIGSSTPIVVPKGAVVIRDAEKILSQFGYRDSDSQKITATTVKLMLLACRVGGISQAQIDDALDRAVERLSRACNARTDLAMQSQQLRVAP